MIEINVQGLEAVRAAFARLVPETQTRALRGLADAAFAAAQRQVDTHTQTGALARSLRLRSDGDGGWIIDHDQQQAPYAPFVHWRTRPHEIRARTKKALYYAGKDDRFHFWWGPKTPQERAIIMQWMKKKSPGSVAHFRWPMHPGYAGDAWLVKAADKAVRQFDAIVQRLEI